MKKIAIIISGIILLSGCFSSDRPELSSTDSLLRELKAERQADSMVKVATRDALFDTVGLSKSPVKVIEAKMIKKDYSSYKDIEIKYKNVSDKRIEAIKFSWYGKDAFGEDADMGGYQDGFGNGFIDDPLAPGKATRSQWSILSRNGKKVVLAWPTEVVFSDDTKWIIGK